MGKRFTCMGMIYTFILCAALMSCGATEANNNSTEEVTTPKKSKKASNKNFNVKSGITEKANKQPKQIENPKIVIEVEGLEAQTSTLVGMFTDQRYRADSAKVDANGRMIFQRDKPYEPGLYFAVFNDNSFLQFLVDKDQTFSMKTTKKRLIKDMVVKGNLDNQLLYDDLIYQEELKPKFSRIKREKKKYKKNQQEFKDLNKQQTDLNQSKLDRLEEQFKAYPNTLFTSFKRAGQNPVLKKIKGKNGKIDEVAQVVKYRKEFWDGVDFADERLLYTPVIKNKLERYMEKLTPQNPDSIKQAVDDLMVRIPKDAVKNKFYSFFVNWIGLKFEPGKTKLMDAEAVYVHMVQQYYNYDQAFWSDSAQTYALQLRAHEMAGSLVGNDAPDVRAKNPQGKFKSIYEIEDDYIIVYMYNPQCEHCAVESPKLVEFYKEWKPKGVEVFAIAIDTDDTEWKNYVKKNKMNFINVFDPTNASIYAKYYVNVTPELYLINPDRKIIGKNLKVSQVETVMNRDKEKRG